MENWARSPTFRSSAGFLRPVQAKSLGERIPQDVGEIASPTVASFVAVQTVAERLVGDALHVYVQGSVDAQPALVDRFGPVRGFKVLTNLLEEVRREVVARILNVQTDR